jgi:hypothetical protein
VLEFSLAKEAGFYHSMGIGDAGATQAVGDGLSDLFSQKWFFPAVFGIGAIFLLKK